MKHIRLFLVMAIILLVTPTLAFPGNFGFTSANPLPNATVVTSEYTDDLVGITNNPTNSDTVVWYLWEGTTVGATTDAINSVNLILSGPPDLEWTLTIPAATINSLADGDYIWDVIATDDGDGQTSHINGGPFTFTVDLVNLPVPADGATLTGPGWTDFSFADNGADWYYMWIGYGADAADPYGYTALVKWYQADDDSFAGTPGAGICTGGVCTLPRDDTTMIYVGGNEKYEWWITYWSDAKPDYLNQWEGTSFTINYPPPTTTMPSTSPASGLTTTAPAEITWNQDAGTLWYQVWVGPNDYSETIHYGWSFADDICNNNVCTVDTSTKTFVSGTTYEMWMEFWGPGGYSAWGDVSGNPLSFTYEPNP